MSFRKFFVAEVGEPLDALSTNKNRSRVVVAGKTVTRIFSINPDGFQFLLDRSKSKKVHYLSGSIAWSPLKDNLIASTSSNGTVITWDPNAPHIPDRSYRAHKMVATKVCFNEFNENILISGSKDATVWLYDLRSVDPVSCFASNSDDSIRDLQFSVDSKSQEVFVSAGDSGTIRFWDIRRPDRVFKEFVAHSSQVYSLSLNFHLLAPSQCLIATAGRDKYIRIWDWFKHPPDYLYSIEMMSCVTKISWCPSNPWHIACCFSSSSAFVSNDNSVLIWDIRRPFLPYASFENHLKTCTDISWPRNGPDDRFLSCGKDGRLIMNLMRGANNPIKYANEVAVNCNSAFDGIIASMPYRSRKPSKGQDPFKRKSPSAVFSIQPSDPFILTSNNMIELGSRYKFSGAPFNELCEHNASVAESIGKHQDAYTWRIISIFCSSMELNPPLVPKEKPQRSLRNSPPPSIPPLPGIVGVQASQTAVNGGLRESVLNLDIGLREEMAGCNATKKYRTASGSLSMQSNASFSNKDDQKLQKLRTVSGSLSMQNTMNANKDFFFGVEELNLEGIQEIERSAAQLYCNKSTRTSLDLFKLKDEALDIEILEQFETADSVAHTDSLTVVEERKLDDDLLSDGISVYSSTSATSQESLSGDETVEDQLLQAQSALFYDPLPKLKSILEFYSSLGDVQICSTICMVMGDKLLNPKSMIRPSQIEHWFFNYIEILERLRLWKTAAQLIKNCYRPKVNQLSRESTFVKVLCLECKSSSLKSSLSCKSCKTPYNYRCCVCDLMVRGLWSSCPECGHGGHLTHMEEWFSSERNISCPFPGCGHECQRRIPVRN